MANEVEIILSAKDEISAVIRSLKSQLDSLGGSGGAGGGGRGLNAAANQADNLDGNLKKAQRSGRALAGILSAVASSFVIRAAINQITNFEQQISNVQAITQDLNQPLEETANNMSAITQAARDLGATTRFSATEAAQGIEFLGRAGFDTQQILDSIDGTLNLAASSNLSLAEAADITTNVLSGFNAAASEANLTADILAKTAASSNTNVSQLGDAFKFVAPVAGALNISIADTAAALGTLANAGLQASTGGTGLRRVLSELISPSAATQRVLREVGLSADDLKNRLEAGDLTGTIQALGEANLSASQALQIFGDRGGPAATVLARLSENYDQLAESTNNAAGTAEEIARIQEDNLAGATRQLLSALSELALQIGDGGLLGGLRSLVDNLTLFVRAITGTLDPTSELSESSRRLAEATRILGEQIGGLFELLLGGAGVIGGTASEFSIFQGILLGVSLAIAAVRDGFTGLAIIFTQIGSRIISAVVRPIELLLQALEVVADFTGLDNISQAFNENREALERFREVARGGADELLNNFAEQGSQISNVLDDYNDLSDQIRQVETDTRSVADATGDVRREIAAAAQQGISPDQALAGSAEQQNRLLQDSVERQIATLQSQLDQNLISQRQFFDERLRLQEEAIDSEIALQRRLVDEASTSDEQAEAQADLILLQRERRDLTIQFAEDMRAAEQTLIDQLDEVQNKLVELSTADLSFEQQKQLIESEYSDLLARLTANGDQVGIDLVQNLINVEATAAELKEFEDQYKQTLDNLAASTEVLDAQRTAGAITGLEQQQSLIDLQGQSALQLEELATRMQAFVDATGDPRAVQQLDLIRAKIGELNQAGNILGNTFKTSLEDNLTSAFTDILTGAKSTEDAFRDLASAIVADLARIAAQQIVLRALGFSFGGSTSGGGAKDGGLFESNSGKLFAAKWGGWFNSLPKYAEGGVITGKGTATSDSIPARLSNGEYVVQASAVRHYGVQFIEAINRMKMPASPIAKRYPITRPRRAFFQTGGQVDGQAVGNAASNENGNNGNNNGGDKGTRIVNVVDPELVRDFMESSAGEEVIINTISINSEKVKRAIQ